MSISINHIYSLEKEHGFILPQSYKDLLTEFDLFMIFDYQNTSFHLYNLPSLFETAYSNNIPYCSSLTYFITANEHKYQDKNSVYRNDSDDCIARDRVEKGFIFGELGDGAKLYFDTQDNMSVWQLWDDEGSISKVADSFDTLLADSVFSDKE